ncbi:hypothetical protein [Lactovum odontotermitis]
MTENFEATLQALRERFIENFPQDEAENTQLAVFSALSADEKLEKVSSALDSLDKEISSLTEKMAALSSDKASDDKIAGEIAEIQQQLKALNFKHEVLEHRIELMKNGELPAKRDKMKRQLTQLEIKRCKNLLDKKSCRKIDAKIAHKKEIFKKVFG